MTWAVSGEEHPLAIEEIKSSNSERVVTIVGGALLDSTVHRTLKERLRGDDKDTVTQLLKPTGPIGNAQPKIQMLYLLGAFDASTRDAMIGLTEVRNFFAHNLSASLDSKDERLAGAFRKLTLHVGRTYYPHHFFGRETVNKIESPRPSATFFFST
jgi:DNA-binding MltR family transcriptional regulator